MHALLWRIIIAMCGIAGIYSLNKSIQAHWAKDAADILKHRGPDDEGYLAVDLNKDILYHLTGRDSKVDSGHHIDAFSAKMHLMLAHRRLAIIDPSAAGHQPMANRNKTIWIVYNGEIYNYIELRGELRNSGFAFHTNTDTEVILAAYEQWGTDCVNKFTGMWAFAIYDKNRNIFFGSRDRWGVKPFYYFHDGNYFAFTSEIKALLKFPFITKKTNPAAVFDYLVFGFEETEEEGFFKGIYELFPSHSFKLDLKTGVFSKWKYYELKYNDSWENFNGSKLKTYLSNTRDLIFNAVKIRLRSDVPLGSCLSGGIDSSTIVSVINDLLHRERIAQIGERQKVFTASYEDKIIDEGKWAKCVVDSAKTVWYQTFPQVKELLGDLEKLVYIQDIPFGSTSIYAQYRVMKLAHETGVKVLLDGQGGDELFTGYATYYRAFFSEIIKNFDIAAFIYESRNLNNAPINRFELIKSLLRLYALNFLPVDLIRSISQLGIKGNRYLSRDFWQTHKDRFCVVRERAAPSLNSMLHRHMTEQNLKGLLRYEDRNSMCFSIESRTPFADDISLIEYIFQIPSVYKIHNGWSKYLLRESMGAVLPAEIKERKDKIGFATPEYCWLNTIKDDLKKYISNNLEEFIDADALLGGWDKFFNQRSAEMISAVWRFVNLAAWIKVYNF